MQLAHWLVRSSTGWPSSCTVAACAHMHLCKPCSSQALVLLGLMLLQCNISCAASGMLGSCQTPSGCRCPALYTYTLTTSSSTRNPYLTRLGRALSAHGDFKMPDGGQLLNLRDVHVCLPRAVLILPMYIPTTLELCKRDLLHCPVQFTSHLKHTGSASAAAGLRAFQCVL